MRIEICAADSIEPGGVLKATLPDGTEIAVWNIDGLYYATSDRCTHGNASLSEEGTLIEHSIECSWHFGTFDIRTGEPTGAPCNIPLKTYPVIFDHGRVFVDWDG